MWCRVAPINPFPASAQRAPHYPRQLCPSADCDGNNGKKMNPVQLIRKVNDFHINPIRVWNHLGWNRPGPEAPTNITTLMNLSMLTGFLNTLDCF